MAFASALVLKIWLKLWMNLETGDSGDDGGSKNEVENSDRNALQNAYSDLEIMENLRNDVLDKYFRQLQARIVAQRCSKEYNGGAFWVLPPDPFFAVIKMFESETAVLSSCIPLDAASLDQSHCKSKMPELSISP
ncbi:hypothetical protein BDB00DRAFT_874214 [Zychaea mexicana]|uniref:uncharacterized protein n=1 Tax=Zychaea mexicana TaxID=64656 RepID=UPI0022FEFD61|nr:uncharacterized protein BDB00DRAFT_874214 [Zychaea mexicana]KAI9491477.1 hypothetical protein BDB00DRAFT_874214 [Zychaea mexicana]